MSWFVGSAEFFGRTFDYAGGELVETLRCASFPTCRYSPIDFDVYLMCNGR